MKNFLIVLRMQWRTNRKAFALGMFMALLPALAGLALLGIAGWFITASAIAGLTGIFINIFVPSTLIRGLALGRTAGRYGERVITHDATFRFLADLRSRVFHGYAAMPAHEVGATRSGKLLNRLTADIDQLDRVYLRIIVPAFVLVVISALALWITWLLEPAVVGPVVLVIILILIGASFGVRKKLRRDGRKAEAALEALRMRAADMAAGRRDLAVYGGLEMVGARIADAGERLVAAEVSSERSETLGNQFLMISAHVAVALSLVLVVPEMLGKQLEPAMAVGLILLILSLPEAIGAIVPGLISWTRSTRAAARVVPRARNSSERSLAGNGSSASSHTAFAPAEDDGVALSFSDVSFGYPGAGRLVLDKVAFSVRTGEAVSLIGPSGCGKSTVVSLASCLQAPLSGEIRLFGQKLESYSEEELRSIVAVVGQRTYLFQDTVAANLRIAAPEASDDELWKALELAALDDVIRRRPRGLQDTVGEGGNALSGGEARRLSLARAYLMQPRLWILDELTEGLDDDTAAEVLQTFARIRGNTPVLMISHRTREMREANRILKLSGSRIVNIDGLN